MKDRYAEQTVKLDALSKALTLVAKELEKGKDLQKAITSYVLCGMILRQMEAIDKELDTIIEQMGI